LRRNSGNALVTGVIVAIVGAVATPVVSKLLEEEKPPSCPGEACDGRSPQDEGCGSDAASWKPPENNPVELEARYSVRCHAVWGRINAGEPGDQVTIQVVGGPIRAATIEYGNDNHTRMAGVADPNDFRVRVCAVPTRKSDRKGTWDPYCVQATDATNWR
jgi:hypothetical protein